MTLMMRPVPSVGRNFSAACAQCTRSHQMNVEHSMKALVGEVGEHRGRGDPGVVDQDVQPSVGEPGRLCRRGFGGGPVTHIERDALRLAAAGANAFGDSRSGVLVDVGDQHRSARGGQRLGDSRADPGCRLR